MKTTLNQLVSRPSAALTNRVGLYALVMSCSASLLPAVTWDNTLGTQSWDAAANWSPNTAYPNGAGEVADVTANLSADQTINLNTQITVGSLTIGDGVSSFFAYTLAANGGSLVFNNSGSAAILNTTNNNSVQTNVISAPITLANNLSMNIQNTNSLTINGAISETGGARSLTKNGAATLTLTQASTYSGGTTLNTGGGILAITNGAALGTGAITISSATNAGGSTGTLQLSGNISLAAGNTITTNSRADPAAVSSPGVAHIQSLSGNNTINGNLSIANSGGNGMLIRSDAGTLTLAGTLTSTPAAGSRRFYIYGAGDTTITGSMTSASGVFKQDAGTLTLTGASTNSLSSIVTGGTLLINNTTGSGNGSGALDIRSGTLGGTGLVTGSVAIGNGVDIADSFFAPGSNGVGKFTTTSSFTFNSDSTFLFELNSSTGLADQLVANGVSINAATAFSFTDLGNGPLTVGTVFTIIDNTAATASIVGTFASYAEGASFTVNGNEYVLSYLGGTGNDVTLTVASAIPEPSTWALIASASVLGMAVLRRRRERAEAKS